MKQIIFTFIFLVIGNMSPIMAINLKVGDTETLSIGNISYLQGCQWTISRPNDIVFLSTPQSYSTQVTIKAINAFPTSSPCIVQCIYYYLDLDPMTGRYTYSRTGYKDWYVYVSDNGGSDVNPSGISIDPKSASIMVDEWVTIYASLNTKGEFPTLTWIIEDPEIAYYTQSRNERISVRGIKEGHTKVKVSTPNGLNATCDLNVKRKEYAQGEYFTYKSIEGVTISFQALEDKTCQIKNEDSNACIPITTKGKVTIPDKVNGYSVVGIGWGAFAQCERLSDIVIPNTVTYIDNDAFFGCNSIESLNLPNSITFIGSAAFKYCSRIRELNIPEGLSKIGPGVFWGCTSLINIVIPEGIEEISLQAFGNCTNAETITLPKTLTHLQGVIPVWLNPFYNCKSLKSVYSYIENPFPISRNVFYVEDTNSKFIEAVLYVPKGTKSLYSETNGWDLFRKIIEMDDSSDIDEIKKQNNSNQQIYSLDGRLIGTLSDISHFPKGIYICNGKKFFLKKNGK